MSYFATKIVSNYSQPPPRVNHIPILSSLNYKVGMLHSNRLLKNALLHYLFTVDQLLEGLHIGNLYIVLKAGMYCVVMCGRLEDVVKGIGIIMQELSNLTSLTS